jgi:hypothetical protein
MKVIIIKLDGYGLHPRDSRMECMVVSKSLHRVASFHPVSSLGYYYATSSL